MLADTKEDFLEEEQLQQTPRGHKSLLDSNLRNRGRCCVCVYVCVCECVCVYTCVQLASLETEVSTINLETDPWVYRRLRS